MRCPTSVTDASRDDWWVGFRQGDPAQALGSFPKDFVAPLKLQQPVPPQPRYPSPRLAKPRLAETAACEEIAHSEPVSEVSEVAMAGGGWGQPPPPPPRPVAAHVRAARGGPPASSAGKAWQETWDAKRGQLYYWNVNTGERTWRQPAARAVPAGWKGGWDERRKKRYFWNPGTGARTWQLPSPGDGAAAAAQPPPR
jgi:hypothetical protein